MMKTVKDIPELRFPEFQRENIQEMLLGEACLINPKTEKLPEKFIYIDLESVNNGTLENEVVLYSNDAPSRAQRLLKRGDILYQTVRPYQKNNLYFDKLGIYVASTGYAQLRCLQHSSTYIFQLLHTSKFVDKVLKRCTGTSYPSINSSDLSEINVSLHSLPEQQKIASFLSSADKRIHLLTQKKEKLEQYKKGIMQQIFSQQLRFKDENGKDYPDWEEKFIGEICEIVTGNKDTQNKEIDGIYPFFVRSDNVERINSYSYDGEAILTSGDGVGVGKNFHYIDGKFDFHQRVYCLRRFSENTSAKFLFYFFSEKFYQRVKKMSAKNSVDSVRMDMISKMNLFMPCKQEQQKIASFLSNLDQKISIVNQQIELTRKWKQGLLQKMFV